MKNKVFLAFDIDGTIYDSSGIIVEAYHRGIKEFTGRRGITGFKMPGYRELVDVVGIPVEEIFRTLFPGLKNGDLQEINDLCTEAFVSIIGGGGGRIFEHVYSSMELLFNRGYIMLAASNGRKEYVEAILKAFGLFKFFSPPFVFAGAGIPDKTAIVAYYRENVSRENTLIMIGDRFTDREAAEKNGIPFIGCAFGHAGENEISGSRWIAGSFGGIPGIIDNILTEV